MNRQTIINRTRDALKGALACYTDGDFKAYIGQYAIANMFIDVLLDLHDYDFIDDPANEEFAKAYAFLKRNDHKISAGFR